MKQVDAKYMVRCLQLARLGEEWVAPNPMVGAVLVCDDRIVSEGWHRCYGGPHAEPNTIVHIDDAELLARCTLYVNLEPCSHYGKTPPCAELIIAKGIKHVVVGTLDPNPQVAGRGVRMMQEAGIDVVVGMLEDECNELNKRFFTLHRYKRPYVTIKWAQTSDGYIDSLRQSKDEVVTVISNRLTKQLVHQLRARNMAIMVGTRTALLDNPKLRTTRWCGKNPLRVVVDRQLRLTEEYNLLNDGGRTLVFAASGHYAFAITAELVHIDFESDIWAQIGSELAKRNVHSLIIEGGMQLIESAFAAGFWDEVQVEISCNELAASEGVRAPQLPSGRITTDEVEENKILHILP